MQTFEIRKDDHKMVKQKNIWKSLSILGGYESYQQFLFQAIIFAFAVAGIAGSLQWASLHSTEKWREERVNIYPPQHLSFFSFGQQMTIADFLWVRAIIDIDFCESSFSNYSLSEVAEKKSMNSHSNKNNSPVSSAGRSDSLSLQGAESNSKASNRTAPKVPPSCKSSGWLFHVLNETTDLAPDFVTAYREGGTALSVLISDTIGAEKIFAKGLSVDFQDWNLYYRAAYHALIELKDKKLAAERFLAAAKILGSRGDWFYNIAGRLYSENGDRQLALEIYEHMKKVEVDPQFLKRMREKLSIPQDSP